MMMKHDIDRTICFSMMPLPAQCSMNNSFVPGIIARSILYLQDFRQQGS